MQSSFLVRMYFGMYFLPAAEGRQVMEWSSWLLLLLLLLGKQLSSRSGSHSPLLSKWRGGGGHTPFWNHSERWTTYILPGQVTGFPHYNFRMGCDPPCYKEIIVRDLPPCFSDSPVKIFFPFLILRRRSLNKVCSCLYSPFLSNFYLFKCPEIRDGGRVKKWKWARVKRIANYSMARLHRMNKAIQGKIFLHLKHRVKVSYRHAAQLAHPCGSTSEWTYEKHNSTVLCRNRK